MSTDGITADFYPFNVKFIGNVDPASSTRTNRTVHDVTSNLPSMIEWE